MALALGDLKDRLKKNKIKIEDFHERIKKRRNLLDQIVKEIIRRRMLALKFTEQDKQLRKRLQLKVFKAYIIKLLLTKINQSRLIRNIEIKSAIQHLAEIAGYKLINSQQSEESSLLPDTNSNQNDYEMLATRILYSSQSMYEDETKNKTNQDATTIQDSNESELNNNKNGNYTLHIQAAYNQINQNFSRDKQLIIELVRMKKNNEFKLKELERLRVKVSNSLAKLKQLDENLAQMIKNDVNIEEALVKLSEGNHFVVEDA